jgi:hypothetical protein
MVILFIGHEVILQLGLQAQNGESKMSRVFASGHCT